MQSPPFFPASPLGRFARAVLRLRRRRAVARLVPSRKPFPRVEGPRPVRPGLYRSYLLEFAKEFIAAAASPVLLRTGDATRTGAPIKTLHRSSSKKGHQFRRWCYRPWRSLYGGSPCIGRPYRSILAPRRFPRCTYSRASTPCRRALRRRYRSRSSTGSAWQVHLPWSSSFNVLLSAGRWAQTSGTFAWSAAHTLAS